MNKPSRLDGVDNVTMLTMDDSHIYKFIQIHLTSCEFWSYCLHVCFTRLFFATAEEVAQGHRSPAATQCLDVWTVGSFQVLICWYWSMDFFSN